ncbi:MAG: DUF5056 domain-containing protein [Paludibacter sp.]|jgi:Domain of unknown function (DUF5056)
METNDKMLKQFFSEQKQEIADNGFSKRVFRNLPETTDRSWIVWVFAAFGMTIFIYFGLTSGLLEHTISLLFKSVPYYYLLAGITCLPLLGTAGYYLSQNKNYQVI